jgi:hypothetical protein
MLALKLVALPCVKLNRLYLFLEVQFLPLPDQDPLLRLSLPLLLALVLPLFVDPQKHQCVRNQLLFDVLIQRGVGSEAGSVVDLSGARTTSRRTGTS